MTQHSYTTESAFCRILFFCPSSPRILDLVLQDPTTGQPGCRIAQQPRPRFEARIATSNAHIPQIDYHSISGLLPLRAAGSNLEVNGITDNHSLAAIDS